MAQVEGWKDLARLQPAQGLEHVPGDGVVLAERVAPRDHQDRLRTVDHAVTSLARQSGERASHG